MNPAIIILIVTVAVSLWAFQDKNVINNLIFSPYIITRSSQWYRIITHAFIHANGMHLLFNMIALWSFGTAVVNEFSSEVHFYIMYFAAIIFSSASSLIKHRNNYRYASLGASGAVSAVIFSYVLFNPWNMIYVFIIPCPGILFSVAYLWYSNYMSRRGGDVIAHDAHFYGAVFGLIYPIIINPSTVLDFVDMLIHPTFL